MEIAQVTVLQLDELGAGAGGPGASAPRAAATVGAAVSSVDLTDISDEAFAGIRQALDIYSMLVFREQDLTKRNLADFARRFGDPYVPAHQEKAKTLGPEFPEIYVVSNVRNQQGKRLGGLGNGEVIWHSDLSYLESPPEFSMLYAVEVPAEGGETSICNMATALDTMPCELRRRIEGRLTKHDATLTAGGSPRIGVETSEDPRTSPGRLHPAICVHPRTGREFLYLGRRRNACIDGLPLQESEALLDDLWAHATRPEHIWAHEWDVGDLLVWNNRSTIHRREPFDPGERRFMHHVRVKGTRPPQASRRTGSVPRR